MACAVPIGDDPRSAVGNFIQEIDRITENAFNQYEGRHKAASVAKLMRIVDLSGVFKDSSHAYANLYRALVVFARTQDLNADVDCTCSEGQGRFMFAEPCGTVREVFVDVLNPDGCMQLTIKHVLEEEPHYRLPEELVPASRELFEVAKKIQDFIRTQDLS